jgi:hypothetical protein
MESLHKVEAFIILDITGRRVCSKYFCPGVGIGSDAPASATAAAARPWPTVEKQRELEAALKRKTVGDDHSAALARVQANAQQAAGGVFDESQPAHVSVDPDVMTHEGHAVIAQQVEDLLFFTVGPAAENEAVLLAVHNCVIEALHSALQVGLGTLTKRALLEDYHVLALILDEVFDDGVILETSAASVVQDVAPYVQADNQTEVAAKHALTAINKYLKQAL